MSLGTRRHPDSFEHVKYSVLHSWPFGLDETKVS